MNYLTEIHRICREYGINNYTINGDGSIDVDGYVNLHGRGLTKLPLKFNHVSGNFLCYDNNLTTLDGSPERVDGNFYCDYNRYFLIDHRLDYQNKKNHHLLIEEQNLM